MSDDLVKRWDEYVDSMGSVMGEVEHMAQQMRDRIEELEVKLQDAEQRGYANAMEAERILHEDRIEELEKACKEWADVSQSNYQRAKAAEAKLEVAFTDLEQDCEADYLPSYGAMKYYIQRALAELKGEQP